MILEMLVFMINHDDFWFRRGIRYEDQNICHRRWFFRTMAKLKEFGLVEQIDGRWYLTRPKGYFIAKMIRDGRA